MKAYTPKNLIEGIIKKRIARKQDLVITLSGEEGSGKSTCSYQLYREFLEQTNQPWTWKYLAYHSSQVYPLLSRRTPPHVPIWIDENALYKRQWFNVENKLSIEALMRCRFLNRLYLLNGPRIGDWDEYLRNHRIRLWIYIVEPGLGVIYRKDPRVFYGDPWHLDDYKEMKKRCRVGIIRYDDMLDVHKEYYDNLKMTSYDELEEKYEEIKNKNKGNGQRKGVPIEKIGKWFSKIRESTGMTQMELGLTINEPRNTIGQYEAYYKTQKIVVT